MTKDSPENDLVARIARRFTPVRASGIHLGIGDDAALWLPKSGYETILTSDWFLEGSHFLRDLHPPDSVGWKCLARAASDIAAMGGTPRCFLLNLALPSTHTGKWLDGFLGGLRRASKFLKCSMAGGDTSCNDKIVINMTVVGEVKKGMAVLRSGARNGDLIYVSGRLGEAELGLQLLRMRKSKEHLKSDPLKKHLYPKPRLELGHWLATNRIATSMMDLSDGLSTDLTRLCLASGVGALLDADGFPAVEAPRKMLDQSKSLELALHGGDDYELLFTAPLHKLPGLPWRWKGLLISPIGGITNGKNIVWYDGKALKGSILRPGGWDPFL